jgi:xylulokinase
LEYIIAHDFGTSSAKAAIYSRDGRLVKSHSVDYPSYRPQPGWVEQNPKDWWRAFCENNRALTADLNARDVAAVVCDGTTSNCVLLDRSGEPLCNAMIWQDNRALAEAEEINAMLTPELREGRGGIAPGRCGVMLYYIKKHRPELYAQMATWVTSNSLYILYRLTGKSVVDDNLGWSTMLMDPDRQHWTYPLVEMLGFDRSILPEYHKLTDIIGEVPASLSGECGLAAGTKIVVGTADGDTSPYGTGVGEYNMASIMCGTSGSANVTGSPVKGIRGTSGTGASLEWLRRTICQEEERKAKETGRSVFDLMVEEALQAPIGSQGVLFIPYLAGERGSRNNAKAKGSFTGLSLSTTRNDLIRSVIEGIGYNLNEILQRHRDGGMNPTQAIAVGGMVKNPGVRKIFADIMNVELITLKNSQFVVNTGSAVIASLALGWFPSAQEASRLFTHRDTFTPPDPKAHQEYQKYIPIFDDIYRSQLPIYEELWNL